MMNSEATQRDLSTAALKYQNRRALALQDTLAGVELDMDAALSVQQACLMREPLPPLTSAAAGQLAAYARYFSKSH